MHHFFRFGLFKTGFVSIKDDRVVKADLERNVTSVIKKKQNQKRTIVGAVFALWHMFNYQPLLY